MTLFAREEYLDRVRRTKRRMEQAGIDLLLVSSPANQFYLTGYDGQSYYTPQMVVVPIDEEEPIWVGRGLDTPGARFTVFMDEANIVGYPDHYVASRERHPMQFLAGFLKQRGWDRRRIGVEMDDYYYTARWHQLLTTHLPNATFEDAFLLVNRVRMVKSPQELALMRQAGEMAERAMAAVFEAIEPGVRQCDAMTAVYKWVIGGTEENGGTFTCKPPNVGTGRWAAAPHLSWTDEPHRVGEMTNMELGGCRHRYHTPLCRSIYLGDPPPEMRRTADIVVEALTAALDAVRPGATCEEVEAAWRRVTTRYGLEKESRIGYPVGIGYPPTWGELTASLRPGDTTVLEPNMTFHCVPGIWKDDWGVVISETFRITETGAETFCRFPRRLFWKA